MTVLDAAIKSGLRDHRWLGSSFQHIHHMVRSSVHQLSQPINRYRYHTCTCTHDSACLWSKGLAAQPLLPLELGSHIETPNDMNERTSVLPWPFRPNDIEKPAVLQWTDGVYESQGWIEARKTVRLMRLMEDIRPIAHSTGEHEEKTEHKSQNDIYVPTPLMEPHTSSNNH